MTNLEHLIENTLTRMERDKSDIDYKTSLFLIEQDINFNDAGISAEKVFEICQYVLYTYLPTYEEEKKEDYLKAFKKDYNDKHQNRKDI